jgi:hypothetical protein
VLLFYTTQEVYTKLGTVSKTAENPKGNRRFWRPRGGSNARPAA